MYSCAIWKMVIRENRCLALASKIMEKVGFPIATLYYLAASITDPKTQLWQLPGSKLTALVHYS